MDTVTNAGFICVGIGVVLFLLEGLASRKGFGQLVAVMRTTILFLGIIMILVGFIRGR